MAESARTPLPPEGREDRFPGWFADRLRHWRRIRGLSQEGLGWAAEISTRHLSFLESGRSRPSEEMLMRLFSVLDIPLSERNRILIAEGHLARYPADEAVPTTAESALRLMMDHHDPLPLAVLSASSMVMRANKGAMWLFRTFSLEPTLLDEDFDMVALVLDPGMTRPFLVNFDELALRVLERLHLSSMERPRDPVRKQILARALAYPESPIFGDGGQIPTRPPPQPGCICFGMDSRFVSKLSSPRSPSLSNPLFPTCSSRATIRSTRRPVPLVSDWDSKAPEPHRSFLNRGYFSQPSLLAIRRAPVPRYNPQSIEPKWQKVWEDQKTFRTPGLDTLDRSKPKAYILDMFPYPSGAGLHVGHPEGYTATDIVSRYKRMKGFNVLHPMGWDAFGLPAEQYALRTGTHPSITTKKNVDTFRRQIQSLGLSYDWDREVDTTDPSYYRWTQWIFCKLYETWYDPTSRKGRPISELEIPADVKAQGEKAVTEFVGSKRLAYTAEVSVNWCEAMKAVLANEEVTGEGRSVDGNHPVVKRPLKQWMLRIPLYAERLIEDLELVDWPDAIKEMQRNWIGKSHGAEVDFQVVGAADKIRVYTTRPDTLFGATYMVLAPEHPLVNTITTPAQTDAVKAYQEQAARKSDLERTDLAKGKSGVWTGAKAVNPVNGVEIPVWISDYVLATYGTGAIMAVPAHDSRDWEFAKTFDLPIIRVLDGGKEDECWEEDGAHINSSNSEISLDGLGLAESVEKITAFLAKKGAGEPKVNYRLRDWLFSRQRYWGEPFPLIHWEDGSISLVPDSELPVRLPEMERFEPSGTGESPLANATEWLNVTDPVTGRKGRRETNTMPQWAGSCWYYIRYIDPKNSKTLIDNELAKYWLPVDLYVGGAEHAVLHLLYSRFWHKVLFDLGVVEHAEPFHKLYNQGMILAFAYEDSRKATVQSDLVVERDGGWFHKETGEKLNQIVAKMSKTLGNVVTPDEVVASHGADAMRLYLMFMGPLDRAKPWQSNGIEGVHRFLSRVWRLLVDEDAEAVSLKPLIETESVELERLRHQTILKVQDDIEGMRFNTAISQLMVYVNGLFEAGSVPRVAAETLVLLLAPLAPHLSEEIWNLLGHDKTLAYEPWPVGDASKAEDDAIEMALQVNGKVRDTVRVPKAATKDDLLALAKANVRVQKFLEGQVIVKEIAVPGRIVNLVTKPA